MPPIIILYCVQPSPKRKQLHDSSAEDDSSPARPAKKASQRKPRKTEEEKAREKAEKEAQKAAKKAETQLKRDMAKQAKADEKENKKRTQDANKLVINKKDTLKDAFIELGASLTTLSFVPALRTKVAEYGCTVSDSPCRDNPSLKQFKNLIRWKRRMTAEFDESTKEFIPLAPGKEYIRTELTCMLYWHAAEIADSKGHILNVVASLRSVLSHKHQVMVMILGWERHKKKRGEKRDVENEFVDLQIERCPVIHVEDEESAVTWIYNLTADLGMKPHKLLQKSYLSFCPNTKITTGIDPNDTFKKMLSQIPMITESAAAGIAEERHTLNTLFEAFEACATDRERSELLFNTEIRYNKDGTSSKRGALKGVLAARVATVMWGEDPLRVVAAGS
ncbi:hypothetical protein SISNIDRAFT_492226 [Sistotremastrum niveocremeum HHB9708]|uniref:ERCC4 domain-containing protein n=1 Tax=Sistotremastrum niveocremeum HHB9708 TaxID=1314777 RepID=A0A165AEG9_9AGAM|nr:hypothetical protein SISNIDRAFT_492226 [Sistotremastrum niveocremeum HHB9708]